MTATIQTLCCCCGAGRCGNHRTPVQHHSLHSSCHCRHLACVDTRPRIELAPEPELVLFGILPPLLYSAGVAMSWREFRFNLRPLALLASCPMHHTGPRVTGAHWPSGARRLALKAAYRQRYREKQVTKHGEPFARFTIKLLVLCVTYIRRRMA